MKTIYVVTGNSGKVASLQRKLENYNINVEQVKLNLFENGFPGVYTKYVLGSIGVDGIMDIMKDKDNRECTFKSVVTFIDANGNPTVFKGDLEEGVIADEIDKEDRSEAWSELWKIFIPKGYNKTLSQFSSEERAERSSKRKGTTAFKKFAEWIVPNAEGKL